MRAYTAVLAILGGAMVVAQPAAPRLPAPFATPSARNRPWVVEAPPGARLQVPAGFSVEVWAEGFSRPRFMLQGAAGEVLLSDSGAGVIYAFANGRGEERKPLLTGLQRPYGLAFWRDSLYVAETHSVKRHEYDAKALTAGPGEEVIPLPPPANHWTRSLLFDRAGEKLYVGVGSATNIDPDEPRRGAINRYDPDGGGHEIFASGTRNPVGMHWYPGTDTLWAVVIERDSLGDDLPPDYFTHIEPNGFYGWPWAYFGPNPEPRHGGAHPELVAKTLTPDLSLGAHVAPIDFAFYTGTQFPAEYRGGAFIALHGSWNRSRRVGYSVVFVPFEGGRPSGPPRDFLTGWMFDPDIRYVWGRPAGVLMLDDGSLLVSDDGGKKIWRVTYDAAGARERR